jgi:enoyl-[acyl-carrier protein] reductase III
MTGREFGGRTALVTGGSRGIGRAIAVELAVRGADVVLTYRRDSAAAEEVVAEIADRAGKKAVAVQADMGVPEDVGRLFDVISERWGCLDVMVLNAAATAFKDLADVTPGNISKTFAITIDGSIQAAQRARPLMAGRQATIISISSMDSVRHVPKHGLLGIAKAGMESLTRFLAVEFAADGITCNAVLPGPVITDSLSVVLRSRGDEYLTSLRDRVRRTPLGRFGHPDDVARVVAMLSGPDARWITGQVIVADGGFLLTTDELTGLPGRDTTVGEQELLTQVGKET